MVVDNAADRFARAKKQQELAEHARRGADAGAAKAAARSELIRLVESIQSEGRSAVPRLMALPNHGDPELATVLTERGRLFRSQGPKREEKATWKVLSVELPAQDWSHTMWFTLDSTGMVREPTGYPLTASWLQQYEEPGRERSRLESRKPEVLNRVLEALRRLGTERS